MPTREEIDGDLPHAAALERRHRFAGLAVLGSLARFDFNEDDGRAVARDDVDFSTAAPVAARNYRVPAPFQFSTSEIFPKFSKRDAGTAHGVREGEQDVDQIPA